MRILLHKKALRLLLPSFSCNSMSSHLTPPVNSSEQRRRSEDLSSNDRLPLQPGYQGTRSGQWNLGVRKVPIEEQPLTDEALTYATANTEDGARLDISAQGFWDNPSYIREMYGSLTPTLNHTGRSSLPQSTGEREAEKL